MPWNRGLSNVTGVFLTTRATNSWSWPDSGQGVELELSLIQGLAVEYLLPPRFPVHEKHAWTTSGDHETDTLLELDEGSRPN